MLVFCCRHMRTPAQCLCLPLCCRVVESRFKKWLKQQGSTNAQAGSSVEAEEGGENGSEDGDNAAAAESKFSSGNDTKKIAGHFPGWPVGSRCELLRSDGYAPVA